jgi:hypothetical protein
MVALYEHRRAPLRIRLHHHSSSPLAFSPSSSTCPDLAQDLRRHVPPWLLTCLALPNVWHTTRAGRPWLSMYLSPSDSALSVPNGRSATATVMICKPVHGAGRRLQGTDETRSVVTLHAFASQECHQQFVVGDNKPTYRQATTSRRASTARIGDRRGLRRRRQYLASLRHKLRSAAVIAVPLSFIQPDVQGAKMRVSCHVPDYSL